VFLKFADIPTKADEVMENHLAMQAEHLRTIAEKFDGSVRAVIPLFDQEVRGVAMLDQAAAALFARPRRGGTLSRAVAATHGSSGGKRARREESLIL
jgi:hypothetical protein